MAKPNIFEYHDYLLFMSDWFSFKKQTDSGFSVKKWCLSLEVSPSLISMFLNREREISDVLFFKILAVLDLKKNERAALSYLRTIAISRNSEVRLGAYTKLIKIPEYKKANRQNLKVFEYISNWLNVFIRELAFTPDFKDDASWIKSRIRSSCEKKDIQKSLEFLKTNGYLLFNEESKKWNPKEDQLACHEGVYKISLAEFHKNMLSMAAKSIEEVPRKNRFLNGHTFAIAKKQSREAQQILEEAMAKIKKLTQTDKPEEVYHVEVALFPLSQITEDNSDEQ